VHHRRNLIAVTLACFVGFAGFTLVMPFLPLYFQELGVTDVGDIALWSGLSLGVTPAITAMLAPWWGRVGDRVGRRLLVVRSLVSFVVLMALTAYVTQPWQVFALRVLQGLFAGYGAVALTMAAESAPPGRMAAAIGTVQVAQRLGPAVGPVIGGFVAEVFGLRRAFLVTSGFYASALVLLVVLYREPQRHSVPIARTETPPVRFRSVFAFQNFLLLMAIVFGFQFVDRSFDPVMPLYIAHAGVGADRVPRVAGIVFSVLAGAAALGNHICVRLLARFSPRPVITVASATASIPLLVFAFVPHPALVISGAVVFGLAVGAAMTAAYTAAGTTLPAGAHGVGFGFLATASLLALALSPIASGIMANISLRGVFILDVCVLMALAAIVSRVMVDRAQPEQAPPITEQ
jgi:DHA1 family multidrug resistance protein-like MFS transporter